MSRFTEIFSFEYQDNFILYLKLCLRNFEYFCCNTQNSSMFLAFSLQTI